MMMTVNEFIDLRLQQQIAHEIFYRQQIMQRIPGLYLPIKNDSNNDCR